VVNVLAAAVYASQSGAKFSAMKPEELGMILEGTACAVATSCYISDVPCQWEGQNFEPPASPELPHLFIVLCLEWQKTYIVVDKYIG